MTDRGELVDYMEFRTELPESIIVELSSVISDDDSWNAESVDYMIPDKSFHFVFCDEGQWFSFDPFGEIINSHQ